MDTFCQAKREHARYFASLYSVNVSTFIDFMKDRYGYICGTITTISLLGESMSAVFSEYYFNMTFFEVGVSFKIFFKCINA